MMHPLVFSLFPYFPFGNFYAAKFPVYPQA